MTCLEQRVNICKGLDCIGKLTVAEMHTSVTKTDTSQSRSQEHFTLSLEIIWVLHRSGKILDSSLQSMEREDVGDGVGSLVCWA